MLVVIRDVVADVLSRTTNKPVVAKQNDANSRFLSVRIQENGRDMNIDGSYEVFLNVQRPDGSVGIIRGSVNDDGTVKVELSAWVLEQAGTVSCDISIVKEGSTKLTTMTFYIEVEAAACCDGDIVETEEYSVLTELIIQTQDACSTATAAAKESTEVVQMCSNATQTCLAATAEAERLAAEWPLKLHIWEEGD